MAKGASKSVVEMLECWEALVNTDELEAATEVACRRVLEIQAKLHRDRHRPGGPGVLDPGVGADSGGGFPAV
jgi:hypothetical protein